MNESAEAPLASVILPTYNNATHLPEAIQSILQQTYANLELIVVDDGSTDGTGSILASFHDPRIIVVRHPTNCGVARAYNTGFQASRGAFVGFIGSDDTWVSEKLDEQLACFAGLPAEYGAVYSDMWDVDPAGNRQYWHSPEMATSQIVNTDTADYQAHCLGNGAVLFRRECMESVGPFDEQFRCFVDLEFFVRAARRYRFHHTKKPLYVYRSRRGVSSDPLEVCMSRLLLLRKYPETAHDREFLVRQCDLIRDNLQAFRKRTEAAK